MRLTEEAPMRLSLFVSSMLSLVILARPASGQCSAPSVHSCCNYFDGDGCHDPECCQLICALIPSCCTTYWSQVCVTWAQEFCKSCGGSFGCGDAGDCCAPHNTPYCDNASCCESVCSVDPHCCEDVWDQLCADLAWKLCPELPGCQPPSCAGACGGQAPFGCWCDENCCQWDACCPDKLAICGGCGNGACCEANGSPGCRNADCQNDVCALDPLCCEVAWDECCAELALQICGAAGCELSTCAGFCGGQSPGGCWCDSLCANYGDCCNDICEHCCTWPPCDCWNNCAGACGGSVLSCSCDAACFFYNDCCPTLCSACPDTEGCNPADLTGDNIVNVNDLLLLLARWGPCPMDADCELVEAPCPADFTGDRAIDVLDLLFLLGNWG
jgi:hypothetical protein